MAAPRPFTRRQALQNAAFLDALGRTGNARLAALTLGVHRSTFTKRRASHPAFAALWEAALAVAHAALGAPPAPKPPEPPAKPARRKSAQLRTQGGEPVLTRLANGRLQLRRAPPGRMTRAAEQAFLRALSATANVRLSAAAAGFAHASFYARRRTARAFAREMRLALEMGYDRLELAAIVSAAPGSYADDGWRHNDPPPIPPMTADQALQLLFLHNKTVRQGWDQPHRRRRRGESDETHRQRLIAMWTAEKAREAEDAALRRAAREEGDGDRPPAGEAGQGLPEPPELPALEQVAGWSKADPSKKPHNPKRALFGGWRLSDWEKRQRGR